MNCFLHFFYKNQENFVQPEVSLSFQHHCSYLFLLFAHFQPHCSDKIVLIKKCTLLESCCVIKPYLDTRQQAENSM